jgi:gluconate:H+ symporter, GntP family
MDALLPFVVVLVLITVAAIRYHIPPFLTLVGASILFGILVGMPADTFIPLITRGAGNIFALLGIVIFSGVGIAQVLRESGEINRILSDIQGLVHRPLPTAGFAGYLLSVPLMCGITSFVILSPLIAHLQEDRAASRVLLYAAGVAGIISYVLLYPSPVVYAMVTTLGLFPEQPWQVDLVTFPVSLILLAGLLLGFRSRFPAAAAGRSAEIPDPGPGTSLRAWLPFVVLALMLTIGYVVPQLRPLANINLALIAALAVSLASVPGEVRQRALAKGTRNAGIIIFDLAGAGAFGSIIAASTFPSEVTGLVQGALPLTLLPFVIAALLQAAQGSRVVTATVTSTILATTQVAAVTNPTSLVLLISAGAFMFSYVSDPFFWLVKRATGDDFAGVVRYYTLPLSLAGLVTLGAALLLEAATVG